MTLYWIYNLPNWLFGLVCIAAFVSFGLIGLHFSRGFVRRVHKQDHSHNDIVGHYLAAMTVFYGTTLGLVAIGTWNNYAAVQDKVDREAQHVASLYRDITIYPEPPVASSPPTCATICARSSIAAGLRCARASFPVGSAAILNAFQTHLLNFHPNHWASRSSTRSPTGSRMTRRNQPLSPRQCHHRPATPPLVDGHPRRSSVHHRNTLL